MSLFGLSLSTPSTWSDSSRFSPTKDKNHDEVKQHLIAVHVPTVDVLWHLVFLFPLGGDHKGPNGKKYHQPPHPYPSLSGYQVICKTLHVLPHCGLVNFDIQTHPKSMFHKCWYAFLLKSCILSADCEQVCSSRSELSLERTAASNTNPSFPERQCPFEQDFLLQ